MSQDIFLEFKYLKNRVIDLGTGDRYDIPYRNEPVERVGQMTYIPVFNMDKIHKVKLAQEKPELPEREQGMSERLHQELCDEAYRLAMDSRRKNEEIRRRLRAFVADGTIEIVNDPFLVKTRLEGAEPEEEVEEAAASETKPKTSTRKK